MFIDVGNENPVTVNQSAKLLHALGLLQQGGPETGKFQEKIAPVNIESDMTMAPYLFWMPSTIVLPPSVFPPRRGRMKEGARILRLRNVIARKRNGRAGKINGKSPGVT